MKAFKQLSATLFLLFLARITMAQDVIVKNDQTTVMSKVIEITSNEIKYKKWNNQDGPIYSISRTEVSRINYENGEVEDFSNSTSNQQNNATPQVQYLNSYMTHSVQSLYLNGRKLSDYEVKSLVDAESYQLYQKGISLSNTGLTLEIVGGVTALVAIGMRLFNSDLQSSDASVIHTPAYKTYIAFGIVGGVTFGSGLMIGLTGEEKIGKVAEEYNKNHSNAYSLNISPSLMRCETLQSQGNYGLGITLNVNF